MTVIDLDVFYTRSPMQVAGYLLARGCWFQVDPYPEGLWQIAVKAGEGHRECCAARNANYVEEGVDMLADEQPTSAFDIHGRHIVGDLEDVTPPVLSDFQAHARHIAEDRDPC